MPDDTPDHITEAMNAALMARYWSEVPRHLRQMIPPRDEMAGDCGARPVGPCGSPCQLAERS